MGDFLERASFVRWYPDVEGHKCGYCKSSNGSISHGMWTETLSVEDYQELIDRGWRRSGKYCYKPLMHETCCPQYAIRCDVNKLVLSKSCKKTIKKFNKFLKDGIYNAKDLDTSTEDTVGIEEPYKNAKIELSLAGDKLDIQGIKNSLREESEPSSSSISKNNKDCQNTTKNDTHTIQQNSKKETEDTRLTAGLDSLPCTSKKKKGDIKSGIGADPNKPPCKKSKLLRLEKREKKEKEGVVFKTDNLSSQGKSLEEFLSDIPSESKHKLKLTLVHTSPPGEGWNNSIEVEYFLYKKYQMIIHNDPPEKPSMNQFIRFLVSSPLKIDLVEMKRSHPLFQKSFLLYKKYQKTVHDDEADQMEYYSFLVQSPLKPKPFANSEAGPGYGSFHQQYWLDDKLLAVGVIDILPKCISSVYFFYDPDYRALSLGTYGSLRELEFTRTLHVKEPSIEYYYMGFYIHSCPKMRYKGKWVPSYLLCPESYEWFPIENCINKLEVNKYSRLNEDIDAIDKNRGDTNDLDNLKVIFDRTIIPFKCIKQYEDEESYKLFVSLIGKKCSNNFIVA